MEAVGGTTGRLEETEVCCTEEVAYIASRLAIHLHPIWRYATTVRFI